jgi:hypothetical protein
LPHLFPNFEGFVFVGIKPHVLIVDFDIPAGTFFPVKWFPHSGKKDTASFDTFGQRLAESANSRYQKRYHERFGNFRNNRKNQSKD